MKQISIHISRASGQETITAPTDMGLSLMEVLVANGYDVPATCGGMALCATCHVSVLDGLDKLKPIGEAEGAMLDTLPQADDMSRLACQLRISEEMDNILIKLAQ